jgi:DNA polymerase III epsilon subunit-like protein
MAKILCFDTETTGLPKDYRAPITDVDNWPRLAELGFILVEDGQTIETLHAIVKPDGFEIPEAAAEVHGITQERALEEGSPIAVVMQEFKKAIDQADLIVGHNISFDRKIVGAEFMRLDFEECPLHGKPRICTMHTTTNFVKAPKKPNKKTGRVPKGYKWPTLQELYVKCFGKDFENAHNAMADIEATVRCYFELRKHKIIDDERVFKELNQKWSEELKAYYLPKDIKFNADAVKGF